MNERVYNIRQDVFGALAHLKRPQTEVWFLLMRVFPDGEGPVPLPRKIWADARSLVDLGLVNEPEPGHFTVNPEIVFMSAEPSMEELVNEASSQRPR